MFTEYGLSGGGNRYLGLHADAYDILEGVDAPAIAPVAGLYLYDGEFVLSNQELYGQLLAEQSQQEVAAQKAAIVGEYEQALANLEAMYSPKERETWPQQVAEAKAWTADPQSATPFIDAMVAARPEVTKAGLVSRILTNYTAYSQAVGAALGTMQKRISEIEGATQS